MTRIVKEFFQLMRNVQSFSDGQARVVEYEEEEFDSFFVVFQPNSGPYKDMKFRVEIECRNYSANPDWPPGVRFITPIYHPNIERIGDSEFDPRCDESGDSNICLSLLDEWSAERDLEDLVMGILFLIHNPQIDDALSPLFDSNTTEEEFLENVQKYKNGETTDFLFIDKDLYGDPEMPSGRPGYVTIDGQNGNKDGPVGDVTGQHEKDDADDVIPITQYGLETMEIDNKLDKVNTLIQMVDDFKQMHITNSNDNST